MALTKRIKKVCKVGQGLVVFLTQEAKELEWTNKDYVSVFIEGDTLVLKKVKI